MTGMGKGGMGAMYRAILAALAFTLGTAPGAASAQAAWPDKPIRMVVPFAGGGIVDIVARIFAERLSPALGQPIIVDPRPGADANIGTEAVAKSAADGYTWLVVSTPFTSQLSLNPKAVRYDPLKDFRPVAKLTTSPFVSVVPNTLSAKSMKEFVDYAKSRPGKLFYASPGSGGANHLGTELFSRAAGIDMVHAVYKGQPPAITDLLAGRVDFMNLTVSLAAPLVKAGRVRALAVVDFERNRLLPEVPTIVEAGYSDVVLLPWIGLAMPAKTPQEIVQRVNAELSKVLEAPDVIEKLQNIGVTAVKPHRPEEFGSFIEIEIARMSKLIKDAKIKAD